MTAINVRGTRDPERRSRKVTDRAKPCNAGIKAQFKEVAPAPAAPVLPAEAKGMRMF
jgi:hypothetical protein